MLSKAKNFLTFFFIEITRFRGYKYSVNHPGRRFTTISTLKVHVFQSINHIQEQEQTLMFLEFNTLSFIYYLSHLKLSTLSLKGL